MRLSKKQIQQLADIVDHFQEVDVYELYEEHSGIGPIIDITDVESW